MFSRRAFLALCAMLCTTSSSADVVSVATKTKQGNFITHHDEAAEDACEAVFLIGVGTLMKNEDYDVLAKKASSGTGIVTVITDHNAGFPVKLKMPFFIPFLGGDRYGKLYSSITSDLGKLIPVCEGKSPKIIVGGHSASGMAAIESLPKMQPQPDGFIGLDPFTISERKMKIDGSLPVLAWGFDNTTCKAKINNAAKPSYNISSNEHRVFYRLKNASKKSGIQHCEFTNKGCGVFLGGKVKVCGASDGETIKDAVAKSIQIFAKSVQDGSIEKSDFEMPSLEVDLFVNDDVPN